MLVTLSIATDCQQRCMQSDLQDQMHQEQDLARQVQNPHLWASKGSSCSSPSTCLAQHKG